MITASIDLQAKSEPASDDAGVPEPPGGAHVNPEQVFKSVDEVLSRQLRELGALSADALVEARYQKFRQMGREGREFVDQAKA